MNEGKASERVGERQKAGRHSQKSLKYPMLADRTDILSVSWRGVYNENLSEPLPCMKSRKCFI